MDEETINFYNSNAEKLYYRYTSVKQGEGISRYFSTAFPKKNCKILDIGSGSGRDVLELLRQGYDAYGVDGSNELINITKNQNSDLKGRIFHSYLPKLDIIQEKYDGILCSAVLMHIPKEHLFDSVYRIRELLNTGGRILVSIPVNRSINKETYRDENGRLFYPYNGEYLQLLFERVGFQNIGKWIDKDSLNRDLEWLTMLFSLWRN